MKVFGFLQYNCHTTTAPSGTLRATGRNTDSEMGLSVTDDGYRVATDKIFPSGSTGVGDLMRVPPSLVLASQSADVDHHPMTEEEIQELPPSLREEARREGWLEIR
jgi:hypothetical protein